MADPIITLQVIRAHLRLEDDYPSEQLEVYALAATAAAASFLNRRIFSSDTERLESIAAVPAAVDAAVATHAEAIAAADQLADDQSRNAVLEGASAALRDAHNEAWETRRGIIINSAVRAAILLTIGHLFANREDSLQGQIAELPNGCRALLQPYRIGLGV